MKVTSYDVHDYIRIRAALAFRHRSPVPRNICGGGGHVQYSFHQGEGSRPQTRQRSDMHRSLEVTYERGQVATRLLGTEHNTVSHSLSLCPGTP